MLIRFLKLYTLKQNGPVKVNKKKTQTLYILNN